jgi:predicted small integral membrane protein
MSLFTSVLLFKIALLAGLSLWITIAVLNNIVAFGNGVVAVGRLMSMQPLRQEPVINTPLLARSVESTSWHKIAYAMALVIEIFTALLLWLATIMMAGVAIGSIERAGAVAVANIALAAFTCMIFFFTLGGTWFAYYLRQEGLQISHFTMISVGIGAMILLNVTTP